MKVCLERMGSVFLVRLKFLLLQDYKEKGERYCRAAPLAKEKR